MHKCLATTLESDAFYGLLMAAIPLLVSGGIGLGKICRRWKRNPQSGDRDPDKSNSEQTSTISDEIRSHSDSLLNTVDHLVVLVHGQNGGAGFKSDKLPTE